jgi:molecular chaperone GrpE (heat shock protein)
MNPVTDETDDTSPERDVSEPSPHSRPERDVSEPSPHSTDDLRQRLDALLFEVRKQGRAGIAAQASAEACLRAVEKLGASARADRGASEVRAETLVAVVEALLPVLDAIDGAASQARRAVPREVNMAHQRTTPRLLRRVGERLLGTALPSPPNDDPSRTLATGISLIQSEIRRALQRVGVEIESSIGGSVDPERHRVLDVRAAASSPATTTLPETPPGAASKASVQRVLRPGYFVGGRCVREADVVATHDPHSPLQSNTRKQ